MLELNIRWAEVAKGFGTTDTLEMSLLISLIPTRQAAKGINTLVESAVELLIIGQTQGAGLTTLTLYARPVLVSASRPACVTGKPPKLTTAVTMILSLY